MANTLAYYTAISATTVKRFILFASKQSNLFEDATKVNDLGPVL
jgi:hypothetical protein